MEKRDQESVTQANIADTSQTPIPTENIHRTREANMETTLGYLRTSTTIVLGLQCV